VFTCSFGQICTANQHSRADTLPGSWITANDAERAGRRHVIKRFSSRCVTVRLEQQARQGATSKAMFSAFTPPRHLDPCSSPAFIPHTQSGHSDLIRQKKNVEKGSYAKRSSHPRFHPVIVFICCPPTPHISPHSSGPCQTRTTHSGRCLIYISQLC
jgi:hypothetical protein